MNGPQLGEEIPNWLRVAALQLGLRLLAEGEIHLALKRGHC